ncbi:SPC25 protein, partial [Circaetus pectoralis]|nr:SPC25 protein [Circaetus pectoralis]
MANVKTEDEIILFEREMKEFWTKLKSVYGTEQISQTLALRDSCKESIKVLSEKWSKKLKEGDQMIDKIQEYSNEILQQSQRISENQEHLTEIKSNERLMVLISLFVFALDEQLQFVFRHIDHKDPDKPYAFTLSINEQGDYEVTSCTPPLDCIAEFQLKVRETNNFSAFVANIRKAFTALSYK